MSLARVIDGRLVGAAFLDDPKVRRIFDVFDGDGEETRIVGGAVRNALMGVLVHEVDFATTADPDEIMRRAKAAHLRALPTGFEHGTATILVEGTPFEITTLRIDVETDGRRAKVRFGRSFEEDALRRDFTMNALSVKRDGTLFDTVSGLDDIARRHVRFIGAARQRIREDFLRILRFFRFHAAFGEGPMDAEAFAAIVAEREGIARLSRERVRAELMKLLVARHAALVVEGMMGTGILDDILGGVPNPARLARLIEIENAVSTVMAGLDPAIHAAPLGVDARHEAGHDRPQQSDNMPDALLRLAALAVQTREDAERLFDLLRLSNAEHQRAAKAADALTALHGHDQGPDEKLLRLALYRHGAPATRDALMLAGAESSVDPGDVAAWIEGLASLDIPRLPFAAADLIARGMQPGPAIGRALKALEDAWIASDFAMDETMRATLLERMASND